MHRHHRKALFFFSAFSPIAVAGCAHQNRHVMVTNGAANAVAADYAVPPDAPRGDVRIASFGITEISPHDNPTESFRALHLRMIVIDNSATQWTFDTRDQRLELSGRGPIPPSFATADGAGSPPPRMTVPSGGKRVADLFYVLPGDLQRAEDLPDFDALWRVDTSPEIVADRTPFERLVVEPDYYGGWEGDYGRDYYWSGPYWVDPGFSHAGLPYGYLGGAVYIRRAPHFAHGHGYLGGYHGGGLSLAPPAPSGP
jgi:hypothetical protein